MTITHDFYHEVLKIKPELLTTFNKHFNESHRLIRLSELPKGADSDGETYYSFALNKAFINISQNKPFNDLLTLVHEYGHAISMQHFRFADNTHPLGEFESTFMEFLLLDYLIKENIFKKDCKNYKKALICEFVINAISVLYNFDYNKGLQEYFEDYETYYFSKNELVSIIMEYTNAERNEILHNSKLNIQGLMPYMFADIFAFDFVNMYREDPEKAMDIYYKILKYVPQGEYNPEKCYGKVKKLGLNPDNSFLRY